MWQRILTEWRAEHGKFGLNNYRMISINEIHYCLPVSKRAYAEKY